MNVTTTNTEHHRECEEQTINNKQQSTKEENYSNFQHSINSKFLLIASLSFSPSVSWHPSTVY